MRHYKKGRKLGTDASHTKAIKRSLCCNLFANDRIKTTLERAKEVRGDVDRVVTWAKRGDVHARRLALAKLGDKELVREIFEKVAQGLFKGRNGGYTRILKLGKRRGDDATIVILELVLEPLHASKAASAKPAAKPAAKAETAKGEAKADTAKTEAEAAAKAEAEPTADEAKAAAADKPAASDAAVDKAPAKSEPTPAAAPAKEEKTSDDAKATE
ncbi:MAG: 50S ribosomal protein L17 [Coriobacteriales bacterium]|jgi:large subunit ribosomal protein L17|nr:50S ribosomal protein L17 [Coriobacteriales bacterium]